MNFMGRAIEPLMCGICNNKLSVFPIHSHLDWRYVCGRCWSVEEGIKNRGRRTFAYEALAQHVLFPCKYSVKGCPEDLVPASLVLHEVICNHKPIDCIHRCGWQDTVDKLYKHFVDKHKGSLIKNEDSIEIVSDVEKYLLHACDELFVVDVNKTLPNLKVFVVPVKPDVPVNMYNYDVRLHTSCSQLVVADDKTQYQMPKRFCFEIDKLHVQKVRMSYQVVITSKHNANDKLTYLHKPISKHNVCRVCQGDLVPPIHQCSSCGWVSCGTCITKYGTCPDCRSVLIRDRALEEILEEWTIMCRFINCGKILSSYDDKKNHEEVCPFRPFHCWECSCKSTPNQLWKHIKDKHDGDIEKFSCQILKLRHMHFFKRRNCIFSAQLIQTQTYREKMFDYTQNKYIDGQISRYTLTVNYCSQSEAETKFSYILRTNSNCSSEITYFKINCNKKLGSQLTLPAHMIVTKNVEIQVMERDD